uniref:Tc1-like transposase DDE domain-containing protein n=1 Tax=Oncorhynchus mykiss TaxID=8022 RepID=A0A8C7PQS2_ONCMY
MSKLGPISHFPSPVSCDSLVLQGLRCEWGAGVLNLVSSLSNSLILTCHWKFNMAPHGKQLSEDLKKRIVALHKDGLGYKMIAKTLKLSCSTVAKTVQRFNWTGYTQNRPRHGRPKKLSARAQRHIQRLSLGNRRMSAASIAAEVEGVGGQPVSAQTIRCTLHQIGLHGCRPRRKPLLKMMHKKARKQLSEDKQTKDMDYWNHVLWSIETKINLFGLDGVKRVWRKPGEEYKDKCVLPTVKHGGGSVMVWGCMSAAGTGELQFIEGTMNANMYCDILKQSMIPSLRRLGRRAVFQHDNDPKHTSKTTTALLKKLRVKVMDWPSMSPDLNPIEHLWGILKRKVEECKVSNINQLCDVVMEEDSSGNL